MIDIKIDGLDFIKSSNKKGVYFSIGKYKDELMKNGEFLEYYNENDLSLWESFYNNSWYTFIKSPSQIDKSLSVSSKAIKKYNYDNDYINDHVELCDEFTYDEVSCDPDLAENWRERYW